ncbi:hypothetical protein QQF64_015217, partial [Cirrhinus molitorella]
MTIICVLLLLLMIKKETFAQSITPLEDKALKSEGEKVTLSCKYDGAVNNLHWYRQYPGSKPEFLAYIYPHGDTRCDSLDSVEQKSRFQTAVEGETVTIKCTYSTTDTFPYLFWYQQEINGYPIYMLKKSPGSGDTMAQSITPQENKSLATVGETVTLSCKYEGTINNLHWYRQYPRSKPEFLAWIYPKGLVSGDSIEPDKEKNIITKERETVKLSCSYTTTSNDVWLYWYRQYTNGELLFLAYKGARSRSTANTADDRFQSATSRTSTELTVTDV